MPGSEAVILKITRFTMLSVRKIYIEDSASSRSTKEFCFLLERCGRFISSTLIVAEAKRGKAYLMLHTQS